MQNFESVEKVSRKFTWRKLKGWEHLYTVLKCKKVHNFHTFMLIGNFFYELNFYEHIWNWHRILRFLIPIMHTLRLKKTKNIFFQTWIRINYIFQFWFRNHKVLKSFYPKVSHTKSIYFLFSRLISLFGICSFMSLIFLYGLKV
jgi:hypothetical protein